MYFSESTLKLIEEVKKREILYNTKYEKRPKPEKEEAWREIGASLNLDAAQCKKHWKNVRDRFVKVMHQRDRHFYQGGTELDAPQYVYFEKLSFMRTFSIKKDPPLDSSISDYAIAPDISPDQLLYDEGKDLESTRSLVDYTEKFLSLVKNFPILYDENSDMRKYRSKDAWKQIAEQLGGKFTVGKLRLYWVTLMKKYKLYLENSHLHYRTLENETIFDLLSFVRPGLQVKRSTNSQQLGQPEQYIMTFDDEIDNSKEFVEDIDEEHLMCEEVDGDDHTLEESEIQSVHEVQAEISDEITQAVESIEEFPDEPDTKKIKLEANQPQQIVVFRQVEPQTALCQAIRDPTPSIPPIPPASAVAPPGPTIEDEFDYFGKKVALQLRDLAQRSRSVARKGEIRVLQLLMELEESLSS